MKALRCRRGGQVERGTCHQVFAGLRAECDLEIRCPGATSIVRVHEQLQAEAGDILRSKHLV